MHHQNEHPAATADGEKTLRFRMFRDMSSFGNLQIGENTV